MKIAIINYGAGNLKSLEFAFERLGQSVAISSDRDVIQGANKVIFPGVGEASSAMLKLQESGLDKLIPNLQQPVLGICLGMQLLCRSSEENNTSGLGVFDIDIRKFPETGKVPQIGWNTITNLQSHIFDGIAENEFVYSVHSYYAPLSNYSIAVSDYGMRYSAAIQRDNFYGVQFHPEKSSLVGERILKNFITL